MVKVYKLTRKENPSELLINSKKTKKYSLLHTTHNTEYKKHINDLIQKKNKRKPIRIEKQHGGLILNKNFRGQKEADFGKMDLLGKTTGLSVVHNNKTQYESKKFNVFTKSQFKQLKRNIYSSIRGSWLLQKFRRITSEEHELLKRLLKAHMYFARIKLIMAKLYRIIEPLYANNDSYIQKVQRKIRKIFDLQMDIEHAYKNPNESDSLSKKSKKNKSYDQVVSKIIKEQDALRIKLMNYTVFYNTKDLGSKCTSTLKGLKSALSRQKSYRSSKKIICAIGRYRKYECKFNKFYYLYREQYKKFIRAYPSCDNSLISGFFDAYLNIDEEEEYEHKKGGKGVDATQKLYSFEKTKCDSYYLKQNTRKLLGAAGELIKDQLGKHGKNSEKKEKRIDDSFIRKGADFEKLQNGFIVYIKAFRDLFENGEAYGIKHHHGLPIKKRLGEKLFGSKPKFVLAKEARFVELSKDPVFIKEFSDMIKGFGDDVKTIFQPDDTEKTLKDTIIPYIQLYSQYDYCKESDLVTTPPTCSGVLDVKTHFKVFSINMDNMEDILFNNNQKNTDYNKYFYDKFNDDDTTLLPDDKHEHNLPTVVCIQNCLLGNSIIEKSILKDLYICVSYSYAYNTNNVTNVKKYNIIYVRKKCIDKEANDPENIRAIDQTDYFSLKNIPTGEGLTLENFAKSFSAVSFHFTPAPIPGTALPPNQPYPYIAYSRNIKPDINATGIIFLKSATEDQKKIYNAEQEMINAYTKRYAAVLLPSDKIKLIIIELSRITTMKPFTIPILEAERLKRKTDLEALKNKLEIDQIKANAIKLAQDAKQIAKDTEAKIKILELALTTQLANLNTLSIPGLTLTPSSFIPPTPAPASTILAKIDTAYNNAISKITIENDLINIIQTTKTNAETIINDLIAQIAVVGTGEKDLVLAAITAADSALTSANAAIDKTSADAAKIASATANTESNKIKNAVDLL